MSSEKDQIKDNDEVVNEVLDEDVDKAGTDSDEVDGEAEVSAETVSEVGEDSIEQQLEQAQATIKEYWDQIIRVKAEMENNRKRAGRDIENAHKFALRNFAESLLPVIDSMDMGQKAAEADNASLESLIEGTQMTMTMFIQVLEKHGLKEVDPVGETFDPEFHQAISMAEDKKAKSNTVISVMQKGFSLNGRLIRPAMVVVAK